MNDDKTNTQINEAPSDDIATTVPQPTAQPAAPVDNATPANWIEVKGGKFICSECENESAPETNTVDGTVAANVEQIKADLVEFPTKIVYGSCPICGMEYTFKTKGENIYMEPSDMLK